ncbi:hypothetical protein AAFF_G00393950 [Aldrovandia affinis]|uniref:Immunoglobulin V-set domain-containing protein n=1 Tax=Aldrovandia affinis TaxID=143900 RepID=A0AAD7SFS4_9TELE|nr:hypothetical protein AAFF_G00393950 [Aldrovandia affinis]
MCFLIPGSVSASRCRWINGAGYGAVTAAPSQRFGTAVQHICQDNNSFSLEIANLTVSDMGLYYCTTDPGVPMLTGHGIILVLPEKNNLSTTTSSGSTVFTAGPEAQSWIVKHCWALLAILCPVCAVMGALLSCASLRWKHHRKALAGSQTRRTTLDGNEDGKEEEDIGVIYSALKIPPGKATKARKT